ncbi:type 1 glutamine amidotransferase [Sagittula salina]|uniref:Type 1 glutamine amidotransferase n=1 Tax=Sagittula salina TaxID=2820268 RepID=A0A940MYC7_9RHOB|nr:type 1 glutamine amidotransferase [Sagittula salina]MBP0485084.1 type 1 glutamine amidotransferase [Sagittula salina]
MHIAILVTNTDFSAFASARPDDGEKFATLLGTVRPDWRFSPFWVCKGEFPADPARFDGLLITGSPASVTEDAPWMLRLMDVVRAAIARRQKLYGACFGHQLISRTLGAGIIRNPQGWGHGLLRVRRAAPMPWAYGSNSIPVYGSHIEQVAAAPAGTRTVYTGEGLPVAGLAMGDHLYTLQHHPEMTHRFICDLVEEYADVVGTEVTARARASLHEPADHGFLGEEIARFYEWGR